MQPEINSTSNKLARYVPDRDGGMIDDMQQYEQDLFYEFQDVVDEHADTGSIVKDLKKLLKKHDSKESSS